MEDCLEKVSSHDVKIVRVGRLAEGASEELEKCLLRKVHRLICYAFASFDWNVMSRMQIKCNYIYKYTFH